MRLPCPFCGLRDAAEFSYEGPAGRRPALDAPAEAWLEAVYLRDQPRGPTEELWRHAYGCRSLVLMVRDVVTHEVSEARLAHPGMAASLSGPEAEAEAEAPAGANGRAAERGRAEARAEAGEARADAVAAAKAAAADAKAAARAAAAETKAAAHAAAGAPRRRAGDAAGGGGGA